MEEEPRAALIDPIMIMLTTTTRKVTVIMIMLTMWTQALDL